jgi:hypothetical protein
MVGTPESKQLAFEKPARYHIVVQGYLEKRFSDCLGDMQIKVRTREDQFPVTILSGQVKDQCELMGILNSLYELHLSLLSVELIT